VYICCDVLILQAVKDVSASYDTLVDLFESIERFLSRLDIYTRIRLTAAMKDVVVKIMVEVLSTLALATKEVRQGRLSDTCSLQCRTSTQRSTEKFLKQMIGKNEIEAALHRLDRLTQDEARATGAQTLELVSGVVQHMGVVVYGEQTVSHMLLVYEWSYLWF
jgi:hypothetical protein